MMSAQNALPAAHRACQTIAAATAEEDRLGAGELPRPTGQPGMQLSRRYQWSRVGLCWGQYSEGYFRGHEGTMCARVLQWVHPLVLWGAPLFRCTACVTASWSVLQVAVVCSRSKVGCICRSCQGLPQVLPRVVAHCLCLVYV